MTDLTTVLACETRLMNAWPALETQLLDGWLMRSANGYSKRANSVTAITPGTTLEKSQIAHITAYYQGQGLRPVVRLSPLCAPSADAVLADGGFHLVEPTLGLVAELGAEMAPDPRVKFAEKAGKDWLVANAAAYGADKANHAHLEAIVSRIRPKAAFATLALDGEPRAWGIGVVERGYLCLQDIVVAPEARGSGLGRALVRSLLHWGRSEGAHRAFLQVRDTNQVALALYASLGFREAYRYSHRVL